MSINYNPDSSEDIFIDENIELLRIQYFKKSDKLKIIIKSVNKLNNAKLDSIKDEITRKIGCFDNDDIDLICYKDMPNINLEEVCTKYWNDVVKDVSSLIPMSKSCLINANPKVEDSNIILYSGNQFMCNLLKSKKIENIIKNTVDYMFGLKCNVILSYDSKNKLETNQCISKLDYDSLILKEQKFKKTNNDSKVIDFNDSIIAGRIINSNTVDINTITEDSGTITICGKIFKVDIIETRNGKKIIVFYITDLNSSIIVKHFIKHKDEDKIIKTVKPGLYCKVRGKAIYDTYSQDVVIMANDITKFNKPQKKDLAKEKRVELHLHTTMSSMDAICSASEIIERAADWGHEAIAITDHGVVQAYPEAMEAAKKNNIKVIYGIEAYLVDDGIPIVTNCTDETIDDIFVVFDIETTGLSIRNDKIIEIGAIKIEKGKIVDKFSRFVNPNISIPYNIIKLTGINDEMVKDADDIDIVLQDFLKFVGNSVVVAHNADFDVSFIKRECLKDGIKFDNPVLDTIPLAKLLFPELKRYKLNTVAKHLGIPLENHHRAVDDAKATADILLHCFKLLVENNIYDLKLLNDLHFGKQDIKKLNTYHVIILAKNQAGLKNLYKLVSESNLNYFYRRPRMPKSLINKYREGLIIGSACEAGEVYKSILNGKDYNEIEKIIGFYDYIEIQPISNNKFLIRNNIVQDEKELQNINKKICKLGEKYKLPVVATCDVHFMDPKDNIYRKILMYGQGFSDIENAPLLYFRTTDEMLEEFSYLGEEKAKEVVIDNTINIANTIEDIKPIPDGTFSPQIEGAEKQIKDMTLERAYDIYGKDLPKIVEERLDKELNSIINNGYAVLYLIAHKLVAKSAKDGYLVGSRGSVGSSLVATMTDITEVNGLPPHYVCSNCKYSEFIDDGSISSGADLPNKNCPSCGTLMIKDGHDIPFETFLGFEGDKEPDIDLNFSGEYQPIVHKYTETIFGKGHVFRAGTIGTIAEKTAYGYVKKYITENNIMINKAEIERLTQGCTGIKRTTGQHPGGVMVVPNDNEIYNFTPIQHPADDNNTDIITTHFDYNSISGRLLKLDILGHDDPTVLRMLQDLTGVDPKSIPLDDENVLSLFTSPDILGVTKEELGCEVGTYGLPEFGTKFVIQMLVDTKPKTFSDLVRISGLSHGTNVWLNNAQYYIKEGHTTLKNCISTRDDIMIYLIQKGLPSKTAFNIMEKVRKGKGLSEEDERTMKKFDVPNWYTESCKKIKYMFPKGHAVAYVMMAVRIAYFKVYYPKEYYATYFTVKATDFDADLVMQGEDSVKNKINELYSLGNNATQKDKGLLTSLEVCYEMYKRKINFLRVDIYESDAEKFIIEEGGIRIPINALQGVSVNAAKSICSARTKGKFISKEDLRLKSNVTKTVIETLDNHGCLNGLQETNQISLF